MSKLFADLASSAPDPDQAVAETPGWSITDVLGHVAMEPSRYRDLACGKGTWPAVVSDLPAFNAEQVQTLPTRDTNELASRLITDTEALIATIVGFGDAPPMMSFDGGQRIRVDRSVGTMLGEFVVHGRDIAHTLDVPWPVEPALVPLILDGTHQVLPGWLNPTRARGHNAVYRVRLRGLDVTHTYAFSEGELVVDPPHEPRPDVEVSADAETWLLLFYGRVNPLVAVLTGKVFVWGRKPWLAASFLGLFQSA